MGCDHPSPEPSWAGLTLLEPAKVLGAPGPARVTERVNDCSLPPSPGRCQAKGGW